MNIKIGIVGLPNVGKSTLFNAITKKSVPAENFPFCTIDPSVGVVAVPDWRLDALSKMSQSKKTVPAIVEFVDIAGLVEGASEGAGLGNTFLSHIREVDAIAQVVRVFDDPDILHVSGNVDPTRDIKIINLELVLSDLDTVSKRQSSIQSEVKRGSKEALITKAVLDKVESCLESGKLANSLNLSDEEKFSIKSLNLLTLKPFLFVLNKKSIGHNASEAGDRAEALKNFLLESGASFVEIDAGVESELRDVAHDDLTEFRREFGVLESGIDALIKKGYETLNLISFFTTGEDESRAWTIKKGSLAPDAAGVIHTDFKDKFIRAETISTEDLLSAGSWSSARDSGKLRTEGKLYEVKDGDVMEFKHG